MATLAKSNGSEVLVSESLERRGRNQTRNFHSKKRRDKSRGRSKSKSKNILSCHCQKPGYKRFEFRSYKISLKSMEIKRMKSLIRRLLHILDGDVVCLVYGDDCINLASMDND